MIDHLTVHVSDIAKSLAFYRAALAPVGYEVIMEFPNFAGLGIAKKPDLWLGGGKAAGTITPTHVAIRADRRSVVDAFYAAAIAAGGKDNGKPGVRPHYHEHYYGAFVLDADGNNLEVVCHQPYLS